MIVKSGTAAMSQEVRHPDLLACLRSWHPGHDMRDKTNTKINVPWATLELVYEDGTTICNIDVDEDDNEDKIAQTIETKIEAYCRPRSKGDTQIVDVKCYFNDGTYTYQETCTVDVQYPPKNAAYGHSGYAGMGKDLASPQSQLATMHKGLIDAQGTSLSILKEGTAMLKTIVSDQRAELADRRGHDKEMWEAQVSMIKAVREVMDWKVDEELKREMARYKIFALHAAFNKVMTFGPPVIMKLARQVGYRLEGVDTKKPVDPMEKRAFVVLKDLLQDMSKKGSVEDMGMLLETLKAKGVDPATVDRLTEVLEEANIAAMNEKMEEEAKAGGVSNIFDDEGNIRIPTISMFKKQKVEDPTAAPKVVVEGAPTAGDSHDAFGVLRDLMRDMIAKGQSIDDLKMLLIMLKSKGIDPATVDRLGAVIEEASQAATGEKKVA